jgi:restriction endonuclease S subunit
MTTEQKIQELEKQIEELEKQIEELKKEYKNEPEQWFKSLLNELEIEINDDNPNSVYYKKDGIVIFELYQGSENFFYCDYNLVWSIFYNKYNFNYDETQSFIKTMVEQHLKLLAVTPKWTK